MFSSPVTCQQASASQDCQDCPVLRVETNQAEHHRDQLLHHPSVLLCKETKGKLRKKTSGDRFTCFDEGENDQDLRENKRQEGYLTKKSVDLVLVRG